MTQAAKRRAASSRNRGFHKSETPEQRSSRISEMKQRMPCAACKAAGKVVYGHWHGDEVCPEYGKTHPDATDSKKPQTAFVVSTDPDVVSDSSEDAYLVQMVSSRLPATVTVLATGSSMSLRRSTRGIALSDTCCARTVCGEEWAVGHMKDLESRGAPFTLVEDHQPFRFGDGPRVRAMYAMVFPLYLEETDHHVLLRVSVVRDDVPLLISAGVLKALNAVMDLGKSSYHFDRVNGRASMLTMSTGHVGFSILKEEAAGMRQLLAMDWKSFMASGDEIYFEQKKDQGRVIPHVHQGPNKLEDGITKCVHVVEGVSMSQPEIKSVCAVESSSPSSASHYAGTSCTKSEGGVCSSSGATDGTGRRRIEQIDHGEVEVVVEEPQTSQGSQGLAVELEKVQQRGTVGALCERGHALLEHHAGGESGVLEVDKGPSGGGTGEVCLGDCRGRIDPDGRRGGSTPGSQVPGLPCENGGTDKQDVQREVLGVPSLPQVPSDLGVDLRQHSSGRAAGEAVERGIQQENGCAKDGRWNVIPSWIQNRRGGVQRGDGWADDSSGSKHSSGQRGGVLGAIVRSWQRGNAPSQDEDRGDPRGTPPTDADAGEPEVSDECEPPLLSPEEVRKRIKAGNQSRKYAKMGTWKRLKFNCTKLAACVLMVASSACAQIQDGCMLAQSHFGSARPDVLEIFGGQAEVSLQFARRGWNVCEPVDKIYGADLNEPQERDRIKTFIDKLKPRLVIIAFPCTLWTPLTEVNYQTPQRKRKLAMLRRREEPFLQLTEDIFESQIKRGDDCLGENPLTSRAFRHPILERILRHPSVYVGVGHGCRYGVKHYTSDKLLKKPTLWFSTSPEICNQLSLRCPSRPGREVHEHDRCQGGKTTKFAGRYTPEIAKAVHRGFVLTVKRKDPNRLRQLLKGIGKRLGKGDRDAQQLKWTQARVEQVLKSYPEEHFVGAEDKTKVYMAGQGVVFMVPPNQKLDEVARGTLKRIHCNLGHPCPEELKRFLRRAGASEELVKAVDWMKCTACAESQRPRLHRSTRMPPHDIQFNDQIMIDCFHVKDGNKEGHWFVSMLDRATMYHQVSYLKRHTPEHLGKSFSVIGSNGLVPPKRFRWMWNVVW